MTFSFSLVNLEVLTATVGDAEGLAVGPAVGELVG